MAGGITLLSVMLLFMEPLIAIPIHGAVQLVSNSSRAVIQREHPFFFLMRERAKEAGIERIVTFGRHRFGEARAVLRLAAGVPSLNFSVERIAPEFWRDELLFTTLEAAGALADRARAVRTNDDVHRRSVTVGRLRHGVAAGRHLF